MAISVGPGLSPTGEVGGEVGLLLSCFLLSGLAEGALRLCAASMHSLNALSITLKPALAQQPHALNPVPPGVIESVWRPLR